jgi:uncharacterized protein (DUF924 family)
MVDPTEVLQFWLDDVGESGWYTSDAGVDAQITERFMPAWEAACNGGLSMWLTYPSGVLAYLIVTDQFSRNMFRGHANAFAFDSAGLAVAKTSICKGWDLKIDAPARQFFYLPLMHSENLCDQDRCIRPCSGAPRSDPPVWPLSLPQRGAFAREHPRRSGLCCAGWIRVHAAPASGGPRRLIVPRPCGGG